jgi:MHS family proline/betaine transporter-like MFS transporter
VGGEYTGSVAYSTEMASRGRRGFLSSLATTGTMMGILLSSGAVWIVRALVGPEALAAWGWRIPFLMGSAIMVFGILLRRKIPETQHEEGRLRARGEGLPSVLLGHWRELAQVVGLVTGANIVLYVLFVFVTDTATQAGELHIEAMNTIGLAVTVPATALGGWLSDRHGRKRVSFATNLAMAILVVPAFSLCVWSSPWPGGPALGEAAAFLLGQLLMAAPMGMVFGVQGSWPARCSPGRCGARSARWGTA